MIDIPLRLDSCLDIDSKNKHRYEELENSLTESEINGTQTSSQKRKRLSFDSFHQIMLRKIHKKFRDVICNYRWKHRLIPIMIFVLLTIIFITCLATLVGSLTPKVLLGSTANAATHQSGIQKTSIKRKITIGYFRICVVASNDSLYNEIMHRDNPALLN